MAKRKIFSIGFDFPGDAAECFPLQSDQSLLDADIIVFEPDISHYGFHDHYHGKPSLHESASFRLVEDSSHWRSELKIASDSGKTIFIFLSKLQEVFIHTGKKEYSGTGRSRVTTDIVAPYNNYSVIPLDLEALFLKAVRK